MANYLAEAFKKLDECYLNEESFDLSSDRDKVDELKAFVADDIEAPVELDIIDPEASVEDQLKDNYIGKVIIECSCCHSRIYKDPSEVVYDDEKELFCTDLECPTCGQTLGYEVIGKIEAYGDEEPKEEIKQEEPEEEEVEISDEEIEEALKEALKEGRCEEGCEEELKEEIKPEDLPDDIDFDKYLEDHPEELEIEENLTPEQQDALETVIDYAEYDDWGGIPENERSVTSKDIELAREAALNEEDIEDQLEEQIQPVSSKELGEEAEEEFPNPEKHDLIDEYNGVELYYCNECGKFAALVNGKKVKADSEEELKAAIDEKEAVEEACKESLEGEELASEDSKKLDEEQLTEEVHEVEVKADGQKVEVKPEEDKLSIEIEKCENCEEEATEEAVESEEKLEGEPEEMVAPLSQEEENELLANVEEPEAELEEPIEGEEEIEEPEVEEEEEEIEDFVEESFNGLCESYLNRVYENASKFETTKVRAEGDNYIVEGVITFESGKTRPTTFNFSKKGYSKKGRLVLEGYNDTFTKSKKAFLLKGLVENKQFIADSLVYNYTVKQLNESVKVYGKAKTKKQVI